MTRIVTIGAGIAGVLASLDLTAEGHDVVVLDKGYTPGGRMATRHLDGATFDHGAQFFTTKHDRFAALADAWEERGDAGHWFHGSPDVGATEQDGHPRWRGSSGMRRLVEELARPLDLRTRSRVAALRPDRVAGWQVELEAGGALQADAVVCTPPAPQTLALLDAGGAELAPAVRARLDAVVYDPCIAVLAVPDGDPGLPNDGALRLGSEPLEWLADNHAKGISDVPAVTIHAGPRTSVELWDETDDVIGARLAEAAAGHLGARPTPVRVHRWRYSRPTSDPLPDGHLLVTSPAPLVVAGDGLAGGRVEGAARSGWAAAAALTRCLTTAG